MADSSLITLISMAAAGARGVEVRSNDVKWQELISLSVEQGVLPLVAWAVKNSPELECSSEIREYLMTIVFNVSTTNMIRRQRIMYLIEELKTRGIEAKLLKGYAVAQYYAHPDSREAVDTDLWIDEKLEKQVYSFLRKKDFDVIPRGLTSHHGICQHKKYGKIEVHTRLYNEIVEDVWFCGMKESEYILEPYVTNKLEDGEFTTLGYTDQVIFLALHMVKHFIESGLSIRMMLDISLFLQHNHNKVDFQRFYRVVECLHFTTLINCIFSLMIRFGGFSEEVFGASIEHNDELVDKLLQDIYHGGYMGAKELDERHVSSMAYNRQLLTKEKTQIEYVAQMLWWKARSGVKRLFPAPYRMMRQYPMLKKLPILLPLAWLFHSSSFLVEKLSSGILRKEIQTGHYFPSDTANSRIQLFRELDML